MKEMLITIFDKFNSVISVITTFLSAVFGAEGGLFVAYLVLNIIDYITGLIKAKKNKIENSKFGEKGIVKKVCYWVIIMTTFVIVFILIKICNQFNINIEFITFFAWFTLACLAINEARSIIENLIEIGINVPSFLQKGLEVAENKIENIIDKKIDKEETEKSVTNK